MTSNLTLAVPLKAMNYNQCIFVSYLYVIAILSFSFPMIYFTELYGILQTVAGVGSMLQYGLFAWFKAYRLAPIHVRNYYLKKPETFIWCIQIIKKFFSTYFVSAGLIM